MIDLHAASAAGATGYTSQATVLLGNDGASLAGNPVLDGATLVGWGALTTIADTLLKVRLGSQDQLDTSNQQEWIGGAGSVAGHKHFWDYLYPSKAQRTLQIALNTGAGNTMGYFMDHYSSPNPVSVPRYGKALKNGLYSQVFGGALTAITWGTQAFSPTNAIPPGKYALLGAHVHQLTNYALIRFQHANFGGLFPGFPVVDVTKAAAAALVLDDPLLDPGYQFVVLSDFLKVPLCPTFNVTNQGTGLLIWMASITADTPQVTLNLAKLD